MGKPTDMVTAHPGMNVNEQEFIATVDDIRAALEKNGTASTVPPILAPGSPTGSPMHVPVSRV
jgi:hypothetical protein